MRVLAVAALAFLLLGATYPPPRTEPRDAAPIEAFYDPAYLTTTYVMMLAASTSPGEVTWSGPTCGTWVAMPKDAGLFRMEGRPDVAGGEIHTFLWYHPGPYCGNIDDN